MANAPASMAEVLDQPFTNIDPPPTLPVGTYLFTVLPQHKIDKSDKKGTDYIEHNFKAMSASDDVDAEALAEYGPLGESPMRYTFWMTEKAKYMYGKFAEDCGVDWEGKAPRQIATEVAGCQIYGVVKHTTSEDGQRIFANIVRFIKAD